MIVFILFAPFFCEAQQSFGNISEQTTPNKLNEDEGKAQGNIISITIDPQEKIGAVSPMVYGMMVEHYYWSVHLGLWAQLIDNGGFDLFL